MLSLVLIMIVIAGAAGVITKLVLDHFSELYEITWQEFGIALLIISLLIAPLTAFAGWNMAKASKLSFNEYWNGFELSADVEETGCFRDGPCVHEYDCDPYTHTHTRTVSDGDGGTRTETYTETHYHSCPYATAEYSYFVDTTLGEYEIASHIFAEDPQEWRSGRGVPDGVPRGEPPFWTAAKNRIAANDPGPVTKRMSYDNYLLASDQSILKEYSDEVARYKKADLLPDPQSDVRDHYYADKVYFIGYEPNDAEAWSDSLSYLNAGLGAELQGDLHLVIAQDETIADDPDTYLTALKSYWSDPKVFGDDAISKNSIIVLIGTNDGEFISFGRAVTGMPEGNEAMLQAIQSRATTTVLVPETLIGEVGGDFYLDEGERDVKATHGEGMLETVLWGLDDESLRFQRISMTNNDEGDVGGGFLYLDSEIRPSGGQQALIIFVGLILCAGAWIAVAVLDIVPFSGRRA